MNFHPINKVKSNLVCKIRNIVKSELLRFKSEIKAELKKELKAELKKELKVKLKKEMTSLPMATVSLNKIDLIKNLPDEVSKHPGMISPQERQLLYTLAKDHFSGKGLLIDGGAFLGGSTSALAYGLKDNSNISSNELKQKKVYSYERAIVSDNFARHADKAGIKSPGLGNSYEPILRDLMGDFIEYVDLHIGDIFEYKGDDLGPIEICFLDILKAPKMSVHCMKLFVPHVVAGGYIIQQDYFFDGLPWIKVMTESLVGDHLEYLGEVRSSALYQVVTPIKEEDIVDIFSLELEEQLRLHKLAELRTKDPMRQYLMQLSRARLFLFFKEHEQAQQVWEKADNDYASYIYDEDNNYKEAVLWRVNSVKETIDRLKNKS